MALVNCPECNENVSQKASVCPHCGYPMKPEEEPVQYELKKESPSDCHGASFMRTLAWIIWIGGLILAIASSIGSESYGYYSTRTTFNWGNFFTVGGTYAVYGGLAWSIALLFDDVHGIFHVMSTLKIVTKAKQNIPTNSPSYSYNHSSRREMNEIGGNTKMPLSASDVQENVPAVVPLQDVDPDYVLCPKCNQRQKANRLCCFNCGIKFAKPESAEEIQTSASSNSSTDNLWKCQKCGTMNSRYRLICKNCGTNKD